MLPSILLCEKITNHAWRQQIWNYHKRKIDTGGSCIVQIICSHLLGYGEPTKTNSNLP